jgi:RNA methyltransferase, TrmH family
MERRQRFAMITSFRNPLVKRIRRLRLRRYREQEGAFFVEGLRGVLSAVESGAQIEAVVYAAPLLTSDAAWRMLADRRSQGENCVELSPEVFGAISERDNPVGLGAIVRLPETDLAALAVGDDDFCIGLVDVSDPGNLGAIVRTADAAGAAAVILAGETVDPYHPTAVKASMGSLFAVPIVRLRSADELLGWARSRGLSVVATSSHAELSYWQASYHLPALVLFGSEGQGLDAALVREAGQPVVIPMLGSATSLNLAVAAALVMYELRRRVPLT